MIRIKILFVCTCNINRSPTFERYFKRNFKEHDVRSAGTHYGYPYQVNKELLNWADIVYVMDLSQAKFIQERFPDYYPKLEIIGISDQYDPDEPALMELIKFWLTEKGIKIRG